ncbi:MAG: hypothetical protein K1X92_17085, partial [Bacteroidia bacterium]|nr:hypothetical protein [Bacteroidia bacterium]
MEAQSCGTGSFFQWDTIGWSHAPVARFFDNTGREYSLSEITIPLGTPIVECQAGMFTLVFQDGSNPFFMDMTPNTITGTGTMGDLRRQIACQVFTDISEFLENPLTPSGITGVTPGIPGAMGRCNIQIIAQAGLASGAAMLTTPLFVVPATTGNFVLANGLVLDTEPQKTIQSGFNSFLQYPNTAPPILNNAFIGPFHSVIWVDDLVNWYYEIHISNNPNSVDYYTAMLHEAMHNLGIISFVPSFVSGMPGISLHSRHTRYLHFDNLPGSPTVIAPNANSFWSGFPSPPTNNVCNDAGSLFFMGANNVYAETVSQGMQHHYGCPDIVNGNCVSGLGNQNTFVMGGCTAVGSDYVKRHPNESEKDILCQLGYGFQAHTNGLPEYGTLHTTNSLIPHLYSATCEPPCGVVANCDITSVYYAESVTVSPLLNDNNGANATVNQLVFHTTNAGSFSFDQNTQSVTFTPNGMFSGWAIFSYVPKCSNGEEGNTAFIFIEVIRCECENDPIVVGDPAFPNAVTDLSQSALMNALPAGSCIIVHGILNIDVGFVIPQGCRWIMMPGSRIDVQENLTVLPNNLFHGCDAMWQGIRVFKHRLLSMESS